MANVADREQIINFLLARGDARDTEIEGLQKQLVAAQQEIGSLQKQLSFNTPDSAPADGVQGISGGVSKRRAKTSPETGEATPGA